MSDWRFLFWMGNDLKFARFDNFHFIHHVSLNSMVFLYLRNIKMTCNTA
jgi:hypothetical protein